LALLLLPGCETVKEKASEIKEQVEEAVEEAIAEPEPEPVIEPPPKELPPAAVIEPPPEPEPLVGLDSLLALAPAGDVEMVLVRDPGAIFDYVEEGMRIAKGPLDRLATSQPGEKELTQAKAGLEMGAGMMPVVKDALAKNKVELGKGMAMFKTEAGEFVVYAAESPDALAKVAEQFGGDAGMKCQAIEGHKGFNVCADDEAALGKYKAGDQASATAAKEKLAKDLPGVDIEAANFIFDMEEAKAAVETRPGLLVVTTGIPEENDAKEIAEALRPGPAKLLRGVQPGAGFVWVNVSPELIKKGMEEEGDAPPEVKAMGENLTGEFLFAGHHNPAAIALQMGVSDASKFDAIAAEVEKKKDEIPTSLPDVPDSKVEVAFLDVPVGEATAKAIHMGVSGIPEADVLAHNTGLTLDGWAFPHGDVYTLALGADATAIGALAHHEGDAPNPSLVAYLPKTLQGSLQAGEVSMLFHVPFDSLHGPNTRNLIKSALKNMEDVPAEAVTAALDVLAPLASATMWVTHHEGLVQTHFALQGIGHRADEEGKAALDALVAVGGGGDPATVWGEMATKYPSSPHNASYKARSGESVTATTASGIGAVVAAMAVGIPLAEGKRNEALAEELGVKDGEAEAAAEEAKKAAEEAAAKEAAAKEAAAAAAAAAAANKKPPATQQKAEATTKPAKPKVPVRRPGRVKG
jgi:hypothetical protein